MKCCRLYSGISIKMEKVKGEHRYKDTKISWKRNRKLDLRNGSEVSNISCKNMHSLSTIQAIDNSNLANLKDFKNTLLANQIQQCILKRFFIGSVK